jgi:uncharacterized protein YcgI (DUF1989 family)
MANREILIPGGEGRAFPVYKDEYVVVTDVEGKQVADFIAINLHNVQEYLSTTHTRTMLGHVSPCKGDNLYSNYRKALLQLVEDTVGVHDTLYPCCDPMRYLLDFGVEGHRNCRENFAQALKPYGIDYWRIPDPVNLFQNTPLNADGSFGDSLEPKSKAGDYVVFKAITDVIVGISACPQDMTPLCGWNITDIRATVSKERGMIS